MADTILTTTTLGGGSIVQVIGEGQAAMLADAAIQRELSAIDQKSGMSRALRETLLAIAGNAAPQSLKDFEASAAAARGKLNKGA